MQIAAETKAPQSVPGTTPLSDVSTAVQPAFSQYKVIRRNGAVVGFEPAKISVAVTKAFLAVEGGQSAASARIRELVAGLTEAVVSALARRHPAGGTFQIEDIQDQVELALMRSGAHEVARAYVLYRERRSQERAHEKSQKGGKADTTAISVVENGVTKPLDMARLEALVRESSKDLADVDPERILKATLKDLYNGVPMEEVRKSAVLAARGSLPFPMAGARYAAYAAGVLDLLATIMLLLAVRNGLLVVVAPVAALAPAFTVVWAWIVLRESVSPAQIAGLGLALVGLVLVATG